MSMMPSLVNKWVLLAAIPYIGIAGYDFWIHGTERQVPRTERAFHAAIISSVLLFLTLATIGRNRAASLVLVFLLIVAAIDEFGFHGDLDPHEKRLHFLGGGALAFCIGVWLWTI